jgi:hypothetical protein
MPHRSENTPNMNTARMNTRTAPKRADSQPIKGTVIASTTAQEVMIQVPWPCWTGNASAFLRTRRRLNLHRPLQAVGVGSIESPNLQAATWLIAPRKKGRLRCPALRRVNCGYGITAERESHHDGRDIKKPLAFPGSLKRPLCRGIDRVDRAPRRLAPPQSPHRRHLPSCSTVHAPTSTSAPSSL